VLGFFEVHTWRSFLTDSSIDRMLRWFMIIGARCMPKILNIWYSVK
jgi:hypothetical protein